MESVEKIAEVILYEGYLLFPYTRSSMKNQQRWTFGGVYPRNYSELSGDADPWLMQTQCPVVGDSATEIEVKLRFLHIIDRSVVDMTGNAPQTVDELRADGQVHRPWEEATERELTIGPISVGDLLEGSRTFDVNVPGGREDEPVVDGRGEEIGALVRECQPLQGRLELRAERFERDCFRLTTTIANTTDWPRTDADGRERGPALRRTMISTHTILRVQGGEFVSLLEPPDAYAEVAGACENIKTFPVLAGEEGEKSTIFSSPIILYDYPTVSPESFGDYFDSTEIDELLALTVMTLTDDEKQEMRETDPRSRAILERTESLTPDQLVSLHGTIRSFQAVRGEDAMKAFWEEDQQRRLPRIVVDGVEIAEGSRVVLHPRQGGDIMDLALAGRTALVEAIEQDLEDNVQIAVTVEDDPGRDLGLMRQPGHRFFFSIGEIEPAGRSDGAAP